MALWFLVSQNDDSLNITGIEQGSRNNYKEENAVALLKSKNTLSKLIILLPEEFCFWGILGPLPKIKQKFLFASWLLK